MQDKGIQLDILLTPTLKGISSENTKYFTEQ